jgi:hypothetical protein
MTSAKYEARFYCCDDDNIVHYVGFAVGGTKTEEKDLLDDLKFNKQLIALGIKCVEADPKVKFKRTIRSRFEMTSTKYKENERLFLVWLGTRETEFEVVVSKRVLPSSPPEVRVVLTIPSLRYDLNLESMLGLSTSKLFLTLLNTFVKEADETEHKDYSSGEHYLRFMLFQDKPDLPPYVYAHLRRITDAFDHHQMLFKKCPAEHLVCDFTYFGHFFLIFLRKEPWLAREPFTEEDITFYE